jgi:hypothetical protein
MLGFTTGIKDDDALEGGVRRLFSYVAAAAANQYVYTYSTGPLPRKLHCTFIISGMKVLVFDACMGGCMHVWRA